MDSARLSSDFSELALTLGSAHVPGSDWYGAKFWARWFHCAEKTVISKMTEANINGGVSPGGEIMYSARQVLSVFCKE